MRIVSAVKNKTVKEFIKIKLKFFLNRVFKWNGKHDEKIDKYADKTIDKVGVGNIMKARNAIKKVKKK